MFYMNRKLSALAKNDMTPNNQARAKSPTILYNFLIYEFTDTNTIQRQTFTNRKSASPNRDMVYIYTYIGYK